MKLWKKDTEEPGGFEPAPGGGRAARITPQDVQEKKFRRSSRPSGGYVMREVDEFLDEVTDTLSGLIAENERLRRAGGPAPAERPAASVPASSAADREAVDAFLQREKGFLQDLGGLVQAHAEELKSMVRSARAVAEPAPAVPETPAATAAAAPAEPASAVETPAAEVPDEDAPPAAVLEEPEPATPPSEPEEPSAAATAADTDVVVEEPIRIEEPEPARTGRADEQDRSLRELFWGEE
jgi:DivIVA domain-containing protein